MISICAAEMSGSRSASNGAKNGVVFADENNSVEKMKITIIQRMTGPQLTAWELQLRNLRRLTAVS